MRMTYKSYDFIEEKFSTIPYRADGWWPTAEEIKNYKPKCKLDIEFLIWILQTNPEPEDAEDILSKKLLTEFLYENLEIVETMS